MSEETTHPADVKAWENSHMTPRGKPSDDGRFAWQSCLALERIANEFGTGQAVYGLAVYCALSRLASKEKNAATVTATISKIAGMVRSGYRKTWDILHDLERIKVIAIKAGRQNESLHNDPSSYTLLRLSNRKPARLHDGKSAGCTRRRTSGAEIPKDSPEEREAAARGNASISPPTDVGEGSIANGDRSSSKAVNLYPGFR